MANVLRLTDVAARTPAGALVFCSVFLDLSDGHAVGVSGPSGAGKTTLLRAIAGAPTSLMTSGRVEVSNPAPGRAKLAYVPQEPWSLFAPTLPLRASVMSLAPSSGASPDSYLDRVSAVMELLQLRPRQILASRPGELSGGEAQRAAIAVTLALEPQVWLADEPTSALDIRNRARLAIVLNQTRERTKTSLLIASHDPQFLREVVDDVRELRSDGLIPFRGFSPVSPAHHPAGVDSSIILQLKSVSRRYRRGRPPAISRACLDLRGGEICGLTGPSGSGKSTLLRLAAGHERPDRGAVRWSRRPSFFGPRAILVPQDARQFFNPVQTVGQLGADLRGGRNVQTDGHDLLLRMAEFELASELLERRPTELSRGQAQRMALAIAFWLRPALLCLDEIESGLEPPLRARVAAQLRSYAESERIGVLIASHDRNFVEQVADRILTVDEGQTFDKSKG